MPEKGKYDIVEVVWKDHASESGYISFEAVIEQLSPMHQKTVGFLIKEDDEAYYLANSLILKTSRHIRAEVADVTIILKCAVVKCEKLGVTDFKLEG